MSPEHWKIYQFAEELIKSCVDLDDLAEDPPRGWWVTSGAHDAEEERLSNLFGPGVALAEGRGVRIQTHSGAVLYLPYIEDDYRRSLVDWIEPGTIMSGNDVWAADSRPGFITYPDPDTGEMGWIPLEPLP